MNMGATRIFVIFILSHLVGLHRAQEEESSHSPGCIPFECGDLGIIKFPFSNTTNPECGVCQVDCDNRRVKLGNEPQWYNVSSISQADTIEIQFPQLYDRFNSGSCDSFQNFTLPNTPSISFTIFNNISFYKCTDSNVPEIFRGHHRYRDCAGYSVYYRYPYPPQENVSITASVPSSCSVIQLPVNLTRLQQFSTDPFNFLTDRVTIIWHLTPECLECHHHRRGKCTTNENHEFLCANAKQVIPGRHKSKVILAAAAGVVITVVLLCLFWRKCSSFKSMIYGNEKIKDHEDIETLLKKYGPLAPERYRYSELKRITNSLENKLGQGGYGDVYKGKLNDGRLVAVKILNKLKGNGEEFLNEVASISRTSHVNIVTLLGFCYEGPKRALIYEFMSNGSLEKFISNENTSMVRQLGWKTLYQISLGIGRGLEYLHRGCNTRILHFDIKPHNILLDENFIPKISDFGLAKLCPEKGSVVSMSGMRGTPGYIAPEVFSRIFGGVSHKSDVYSYGMMILEIVGCRTNSNERADHSSDNYFPEWIYKRLELDEEVEVGGISNGEENEMKRRMIIAGLWCIQTDPSNRPSMRRVLDMLEGSWESLQIPPRSFLVSPPRPKADSSATDSMSVM